MSVCAVMCVERGGGECVCSDVCKREVGVSVCVVVYLAFIFEVVAILNPLSQIRLFCGSKL